MKLYRDDCSSVSCRLSGWTCVFARIVSIKPLEVEDETGRLSLKPVDDNLLTGDIRCNDYCYLLLDTTARPITCIRITVVPAQIAPLAQYQLKHARYLEAEQRVNMQP